MKGEGSFLNECAKALRHKGKKEVGISIPVYRLLGFPQLLVSLR